MPERTVLDLDTDMRNILAAVTPETSLSTMQGLVDLGFSPKTAWSLVTETLKQLSGQAQSGSNMSLSSDRSRLK